MLTARFVHVAYRLEITRCLTFDYVWKNMSPLGRIFRVWTSIYNNRTAALVWTRVESYPAGIYLLKINIEIARTMRGITHCLQVYTLFWYFNCGLWTNKCWLGSRHWARKAVLWQFSLYQTRLDCQVCWA